MRSSLPRLLAPLRDDLFAGFTVAMVGTPQCMAYAVIAGVSPLFGLYTGIVPTIVGSLLGSSSYLVTGPSNATALVTANVLQAIGDPQVYVEAVLALAVLSGAIKLALGLLNTGWIIRYISNSVLMGFLAGASTLIVLAQVNNVLGIGPAPSGDTITRLLHVVRHLSQTNPYVLLTSLLTMAVLLAFKRLDRRQPAELLSTVVVGATVHLLGWTNHGVRLVGELADFTDANLVLHVPSLPLSTWQALLPAAGAVALFSLVEAMSIAKSVGLMAGEPTKASREFVGQGAASLVGGFFSCIPSSGSPSRTAVNYSSGGKTRLAGVLSGVIVLLGLAILGPFLGGIPIAGLAGVVVVTAFNLVDRHQLALAWQSNLTSKVVTLATIIAAFLLPLHIAIYLGAILSIAVYVHESSQLQLSYIAQNASGGFVEHSFDDIVRNPPSIAIVNVEGTLSFGAAEDLEQRVLDVVGSGVVVVILRLRRVRMMGSEGVAALERMSQQARRQGSRVLISGVRGEVEQAIAASGIANVLGRDQVFEASDALFESTQQAIARAQEIVLEQTQRVHGD